MNIIQTVLYQPVFNFLIGIYNVLPVKDLGLAIIALTILVKLALWPLSQKGLAAQKTLADIQPKDRALRKQFKDKPQEYLKAQRELYAREKVSIGSSCLPLLVQLPFFIAIYHVLATTLKSSGGFDMLYKFVTNPGTLNTTFFGLTDLSKRSIVLAILAGLAQLWQTHMTARFQPPNIPEAADERRLAMMNQQMVYIIPIFTVIFGVSLPAGLALYWLVSTLMMILQQFLFYRKFPKNKLAIPVKNNDGSVNATIVQ